MQADTLTTIILPASLFIIMFGMGLSLRTTDFTRVFNQPKAVFIGLSAQMVALPIIAFGVAIAFKLPPELAVLRSMNKYDHIIFNSSTPRKRRDSNILMVIYIHCLYL